MKRPLPGKCHPDHFIVDNVSEYLIGRNSNGIRHMVVMYKSRAVVTLNHDDCFVNDQKKTAP